MRKSTIAVIALGAPLIAATLACGSSSSTKGPGMDGGSSSSAPAGTKASGHSIVFEVTGAGTASNISYGVGGNMSQANGQALPWKQEATSEDTFLITTLSAQNGGSGEIGCRITIDGKVKVENKSSGQYAVVTCTGS